MALLRSVASCLWVGDECLRPARMKKLSGMNTCGRASLVEVSWLPQCLWVGKAEMENFLLSCLLVGLESWSILFGDTARLTSFQRDSYLIWGRNEPTWTTFCCYIGGQEIPKLDCLLLGCYSRPGVPNQSLNSFWGSLLFASCAISRVYSCT